MTTTSAAAADSSCLYDAMTAYLGPLLEKHKAKQEIVFEDLISAKQASDKICKSMGKISVVVSVVSFGRNLCETCVENAGCNYRSDTCALLVL
jgi:hypothetical protein